MSQPLPRLLKELERREDERRLTRILLEFGEDAPPESATGATAAGDSRRLRGDAGDGAGHL